MIEIVDDFLSQSYFFLLQEMVCSENFPWYYRSDVTKRSGQNSDCLDSIGFDYGLINKSNGKIRDCYEGHISYPALCLIKDYIQGELILRGRYDMTVYNPNEFQHKPHIDVNYPDFVSAILYMNDSDGETVIFNEKCFHTEDIDSHEILTIKKTISPKANRLLVFDGHYLHTGHSPSKTKHRVLMNSVYAKKINYE